MADMIVMGDGAQALTTLAHHPGGFACLMRGQLWLGPELDAPLSGGSSTSVSTLENALPLVLSHGAQECDEPPADGRGQIQVGLVQDPDHGATGANALDETHAVHHRPGGAVPLGNDQNVALAERVDCLFELGAGAGVRGAGCR